MTNKRKSNNNKLPNKNTRKKKGGSVIGAGGYGCVFRPALKCKNKKFKLNTKKNVSKLLLKRYAVNEYKKSKAFYKLLKKIPNHKNFFIFPQHICSPDKLTQEDKINFSLKCNTLLKKNINVHNINDKLDKMKAINMRDGGVDLDNFLRNSVITMDIFNKINKSLANLFINGVLKMNNLNVYHLDLKASNMMINDDYEVKIVDWGLSSVLNKNEIPEKIQRPLHFNLPYSIIVLNNEFIQFINDTFERNPNITREGLMPKLSTFYNIFAETYGRGHEIYINEILHNLMQTKRYLHNQVIMRYIADIIIKFRKNNKFDVKDYYVNVFLKNVDVWGFLHAYFPIMGLDSPILKNVYSDRASNFIADNFKMLYTNFLLKYSSEPIPVNELIDWVKNISKTSEGTITTIGNVTNPPSIHSNVKSKPVILKTSPIKKQVTRRKK